MGSDQAHQCKVVKKKIFPTIRLLPHPCSTIYRPAATGKVNYLLFASDAVFVK